MLHIASLKRIFPFLGAVLLTSATAFAQMQQQPGAATGANQNGQNNPNMQGNGPQAINGATQAQAGNPNQTMQDKAFVHEALQGGMAEVQLGQLAVQKGTSDDVKQFGQKMVDDHTKLNGTMTQVAQQIGIKAPSSVSKKDKALQAKLSALSGTQFDDAYIEAMVKDHKKDDEEFRMEAQQAQIPAVKQVAQQGAPVIDGHLQMIKQIAQAHTAQNAKSASSM